MSSYEITLWYYGNPLEKNRRFYQMLKEYSFFKPNYFYGPQDQEEFFNERFVKEEEVDKLFYESEKYYPEISISLGGKYFKVMLSLAILQDHKYYGSIHYNLISLEIDSVLLKNMLSCADIETIFFKLIEIYEPIFAVLDDSDTMFDLMESEEAYKPNEYIQRVFWGNYYGNEYCNCKGVKKLIASEDCISTKLCDGYFVKLSENCNEYNFPTVNARRKRLMKYIRSPISRSYLNKFNVIKNSN